MKRSDLECVLWCGSSHGRGCIGAAFDATTASCELGAVGDLETGTEREVFLVTGPLGRDSYNS